MPVSETVGEQLVADEEEQIWLPGQVFIKPWLSHLFLGTGKAAHLRRSLSE